MSSSNKAYFVTIDAEHDGQRVDNFLLSHLKGVPKNKIYQIIRKGDVRVNKGRVKQTSRLSQGDQIRIPPIRQSNKRHRVENVSRYNFLLQHIIYEDDALLILNKPSGMAVHAGSGIAVGIIEAIRLIRQDLHYCELAHRLDRETSGCLVLAKKSSALRKLNHDFQQSSDANKAIDKQYLTLLKGRWQYGQRRIKKALNTEHRRFGERHVVVDINGRYACSVMTPVICKEVASLIRVRLLTGRTHQVRVHAAAQTHPVACDEKYGDAEFNSTMRKQGLQRLFLHAHKLKFNHPLSGQTISVTAPLPQELASVLKNIKIDFQDN